MDEKPTLSPSGLGLLERCGEAYRRRYIEGERIRPGAAAVTGIAAHDAAAKNLISKAESGHLLPAEEVKEIAYDAFNNVWDAGVFLGSSEQDRASDSVKGEAADKAIGFATLHHTELAPHLSPKPGRIEWPWRLETDMPYDLKGIIDLVEDDNGSIRVRDLKTSSRSPAKNSADVLEQLTFYNMAVREVDETPPEAVALDFLVLKKTSSDVITLWSHRDQSDEQVLWARLERAMAVLESGAFMPVNQKDSWLCNPRFCGYATTCPFYSGRVSVQVPLVTRGEA